jgi:small basic protein
MQTLVTSIVIVVQSDSVTGVFQDFAALTVIAALDNLVFVAGHQRFLGHRAQRLFVCYIFPRSFLVFAFVRVYSLCRTLQVVCEM